jgi:hypothetical protein
MEEEKDEHRVDIVEREPSKDVQLERVKRLEVQKSTQTPSSFHAERLESEDSGCSFRIRRYSRNQQQNPAPTARGFAF